MTPTFQGCIRRFPAFLLSIAFCSRESLADTFEVTDDVQPPVLVRAANAGDTIRLWSGNHGRLTKQAPVKQSSCSRNLKTRPIVLQADSKEGPAVISRFTVKGTHTSHIDGGKSPSFMAAILPC